MAGHSRAVEKDEAPYGLNATRARPVSMVQVRHGCLGCQENWRRRKFGVLGRKEWLGGECIDTRVPVSN